MIRVDTGILEPSERKSMPRIAAQLPAYPTGEVAKSIARATCTPCDELAKNSPVNHRSSTASATAGIPCTRTRSIRAFQASGGPIYAEVLQSAKALTLSDA